ncbi:hypothetical protein B566_EDAN019044 [Ephemera danica]|nr:hypothetical protein B566_EDAN019044 [Ephemera danica]
MVLSVLIRNMCDLDLQQRLMAQPNLTLDSALQQVEASETATDYLHKMRASNSGASVQVFKANQYRAELKGQSRRKRDPPRQQQQQHGASHQPRASQSGEQQQRAKCWRCDRGRHPADECRFKTAVCNFCGVMGHIKPACRKYKSDGSRGNRTQTHAVHRTVQNVNVAYEQGAHYLDAVDWSLNTDVSIHKLNTDGIPMIPQPTCVTVLINKVPVLMEIDSGSGVSLIGRQLYDSFFSVLPLNNPAVVLTAWNASNLAVAGQVDVVAELSDRTAKLPLMVMATSGPALLGRQWFAALGIQPPTITATVHQHSEAGPQRPLTSSTEDLPFALHNLACNMEQIWERTRQVVQRLSEPGFRLRRDKCQFAVKELPVIGYIVSGSGIRPSGEKIHPIVHARSPASREELQVYLGAINYYDRFFANKAHHFAPLYHLLRTATAWKWTDVEERCIQHVRDVLSSDVVLCNFQLDKPLLLATDACQHGLGCVLSHVIDGVERPIMFGSRTLSISESRYSVIDLEATAVVFGLKKCRFYCAGVRVCIIVDHKPLTGIFRGAGKPIPEVLSPRMLRLCLEAAAFDYEIVYREGKKHGNADFCSRFPVDSAPQTEPEEPAVVMFLAASTSPSNSYFADAIAKETAADPVLSRVLNALQCGTPRQKLAPEVREYVVGAPGALTVVSGCIIFGSRVVIPTALRPQVLQRLHMHHQGIVRTKEVARSYCWWPRMDAEIERTVMACELCAAQRSDPPKLPPMPWPETSCPMQRIHLDFFGPFFNRYWLIMVDTFSTWIELADSANQDAPTVIVACSQWFSHLGLPDECVSDNGPAFRAEPFAHFLWAHGVKQTFTPPYHPASNGLAERAVRTIKSHFSKFQGSWKEQVPWLLFALRTTPRADGRTPAELMFGRKLTTQLSRMNPSNVLTSHPNPTVIASWKPGTPSVLMAQTCVVT